jgi:hypothetical protein
MFEKILKMERASNRWMKPISIWASFSLAALCERREGSKPQKEHSTSAAGNPRG